MSHPFKKKQRRPGEYVAELSIKIVASLSIVVIFLIFLFIFRESFLAFQSAPEAPEGTSDKVEVLTPEQYQLDNDLSRPAPQFRGIQKVEVPTKYVVFDPSGPEVYNPASWELEALRESLTPEHTVYVPKNPNYPEIYNPEIGGLPEDVDVDPTVAKPPITTAESIPLWENLWGPSWQPIGETPKYSIVPLIIGTAKTTFIAILIGGPLGILAALYTAFFASRRMRNILKPAIELLAGFPTVVIGFFCLVTVASVIQSVFDSDFRLNALIGGIGLSLAVIPIVYSIAEDALSSVPNSLREASLALGSTEWQTAYRVMLPAASPGVFAAVILGVGRAFGETMIAIMATGNAALLSIDAFTPARTFAATIGSEMGEVVWGSEHYGILFLLGAILFVGSFTLNAITEMFVKRRLIRRFQGR